MRRVVHFKWDNALQELVEVPLDDADAWTIEVARRIAGKSLSDEELERVFAAAEYVK